MGPQAANRTESPPESPGRFVGGLAEGRAPRAQRGFHRIAPDVRNEPKQLTFAELEATLKQSGVGELPEGVDVLTRREFAFVTALLGHGQQARAAREAGYSPDAAAAIASETLRKPKVHAFYRRCLAKVANNAEQLVMRVYERSVLYHAKAMSAAQEMRELEAAEQALLRLDKAAGGGKSSTTEHYETRRAVWMREEKKYADMANAADVLLGSLLGKLKLNVDVSGGLKGVVVDEALSNELVEQRRRLQSTNPAWRTVSGSSN